MCTVWQKLKVGCIAILLFKSLSYGEPIRIATYNVENYLIMDRSVNGKWQKSYPKPESEKTVIRRTILETMPDILVLQEIGPLPFLKELKEDLSQEGITYAHFAHMQGHDAVRHLAVLSKVEPVEVVYHQDLEISYQNKRFLVKRGMLELSFELSKGDRIKLFVVHLKSRWTNVASDPESQKRRTLEAKACRDRIIERTFEMGIADFMVAGDFNDHPTSAPLKRFYQRGDLTLGTLVPAFDSKGERWTHYYDREVVYSMVDGFIASESLFPRIEDQHGSIADAPDALKGSDHRMVYLDLLQL